jgi:hypothetical protein
MRRIKLLIVFLFFVPFIASAQEQKPKDDLQKVKDALVNSVIYAQELEKQNNNLNNLLKKVAEDLKNCTTMKQLDSLKVVYGIEKKPIKKQ